MSGDGPTKQEHFDDSNPANGNASTEIDEADDSKKLFVGGLSWETTEDDVKEYFSKWGEIKSCVIKLDKFTNQSRGFGFVVCADESTVDKVLEVPEHRLKNKKIDPKRAKPSREPMKKIFVGGLDPEVTEEQIKEYFGKYGKIESLDLPFDNFKGKRKSYIFVTYSTEAEAKKATEKEKQEVLGRQCDVRIAVPREQANRQKGWQNPYYNQYPDYNSWYDYSGYAPGFDGSYGYGQGYYGGYDYYGGAGYQRGGGKIRGGRGAPAVNPPAAMPGFHPYNRS